MHLYSIYAKLRRHHWKDYITLFFCIILSVVLVTSYALVYFSPTVQMILPDGGDSRKQAVMIFAVSVIGCGMFTVYASTLFFQSKSMETGIFLALGANKKNLRKMIFSDVAAVTLAGCLAGIMLSLPVSWGIWNLFRLVIVDTREMAYRFGFWGLLIGIIFCAAVALCIFLLGMNFIKRTNIIDIINENRKSEPVREVRGWYGLAGMLLAAAGLLLGYVFPMFLFDKSNYYLPGIWNAVYGLSVIGIYMLMVYVVSHNKRGNHPERYYKNIIPISMMRFLGKQTVKNMCVIILLVFGALFAVFYLPVTLTAVEDGIQTSLYDFSYTYEQRIDQVDQQSLYGLAEKHGINIKNYRELEAIDIIIDGKSWGDIKNGKVEVIYQEKLCYGVFYRASDFAKAAGEDLDLKQGEYALITDAESKDRKGSDITILTDPVTQERLKISYAGNITYNGNIMWTEGLYVLNDRDFDAYYGHLPVENKYRTVMFDVDDWKESYDFGKELKDEIITRTPKDVAVFRFHDRYLKQSAEEKGEVYFMDITNPPGEGSLELSPMNSQLSISWKYYPYFKVLMKQDTMKNMAVFLMLFVYIGIICFASVGIICYTRGITIAVNYKQVFVDLKKLGADKKYICRCIQSQLKKIFFYPYLVGCILCFAFTYLIFLSNDSYLSAAELHAFGVDILIGMALGLYIAGIYGLTFCKFKKTIGLEEKV